MAVTDSKSSLIAFPPPNPCEAITDPRLQMQQPAVRLLLLQDLVHLLCQAAVIPKNVAP